MKIMNVVRRWNAAGRPPRRTNARRGRAPLRAVRTMNFALMLLAVSGVLATAIHSASDFPRRLRYQVGKTYQYDYRVSIDASSASRDAAGVRKGGGATTVIEAAANVTISGVEADGSYVGELSLQNPSVQRSDATSSQVVDDEATLTALGVPLRFKQAPNGVIVTVSSPASAPAQVVNIQKGVLNALQLTLMTGSSYVAAEKAGQGLLQVRYTLKERNGQLQISKQYDQGSFGQLVTSGAPVGNLKMKNQIEMILDSASGVISNVSYNESISTGDGAAPVNAGATGFDGVTAWSTIKASGSLKLRKVINAAARPSKAAAYATDSMQAKVTAGTSNRAGIDLTTIDVRSELALLESEPGNPAHHARVVALVEADTNPNDAIDVLGTVAERLIATAGHDTVSAAYVDVLGSVGTPVGQSMLSAVLGNRSAHPALGSVQFGNRVQEQALLSVVRLNTPTMTTVRTVTALTERASALHDTAVTVLGAVAGRLASQNPAEAKRLVGQLESALAAADTASDIELYLTAVGNAGLPSSLGVIARYATPQASFGTDAAAPEAIQAAALTALRKIPSAEADALLRNALDDVSRPMAVRSLAAGVVSDRGTQTVSVKPGTALALPRPIEDEPGDDPPPPPPPPYHPPAPPAPPPVIGMYNQSWTHTLGNADLGVEFPGGIKLDVPPASTNGISAHAYQKANALLFGNSFEVIKGELRTFHQGNDQVFGAYLSIANNLIRRQFELRVPCADDQAGNLYTATATFLDVTTKIPVFAVITLDLNVRATGSFTLDWNFRADICRFDTATVQAGIVPRVWVSAEASAYLDIWVARGGATLTAILLDTSVPAQASVVLTANPPAVRFCVDIQATTRPLSGYLDVWADALGVRVGSARLWEFSTPASSFPLLVQCF